jgi:polyisoprenyl-phosphate glycosyltransferase
MATRKSEEDPLILFSRHQTGSPATPPEAVVLSVIVPLFDEQENLPVLYRRLTDTLTGLGIAYEIVFVNDGSRDRTHLLLGEFAAFDSSIVVLNLSRNFGHQAAVTAGLEHGRGDAVVVLDGDLQDPPEVIPELLERWREGFDIVYAVRKKRKEGPLKRLGYFTFYRFLRAVADLDIPLDTGDFCLMDRRAVRELNGLPEQARFIRGLRTFIGFRQVGVSYERDARFAGVPKYTFRKLAALAVDGVFNFSATPVRAIGALATALTFLGIGLLGCCGFAWAISVPPPGWQITLSALIFLSGLQIGCITILGLYILKIFTEVKGRPSYILDTEASGILRPRVKNSSPSSRVHEMSARTPPRESVGSGG